jgi:hypothetical protein
MSDPLDEMLNALRSPALPDEQRGRDASVESMRAALLDGSETTMPQPTSRSTRRLSVAAVVAAGVLGFAGVAAAGPGGIFRGDDSPASTTSVAASTTDVTADATTVPESTDDAPTTSAEPASTTTDEVSPATTEAVPDGSTDDTLADQPLVDDPATDFDETQCAAGNHGQTVSSVAQSVEPGPGHGQAVSEAAQSSCGKHDADADEQPDEGATTTTTDDSTPGEVHGQGQGESHRGGQADEPADGAAHGQAPTGHGKPDDPGSQGKHGG